MRRKPRIVIVDGRAFQADDPVAGMNLVCSSAINLFSQMLAADPLVSDSVVREGGIYHALVLVRGWIGQLRMSKQSGDILAKTAMAAFNHDIDHWIEDGPGRIRGR